MRSILRPVTALLIVATLALTGCTADTFAQQNKAGSGKNYIAGSGVTEVAQGDRGAPVVFSGTTEHGKKVSSKDYLGQVLVVNFWWAGCAPCRIEASDLQKISTQFAGKGASFLGVNTRNQAQTALAYDKQFKVTYPSVLDAGTGAAQLAFSGSMQPGATPATMVLDQKGRIAARIEGPITDQPSTLETIISDTIAEGK